MPEFVALRFQCPRCQAQNQAVELTVGSSLACSACDWTREVTAADFDGPTPCCCLACGNDDLWRQKDFPQTLGMAFVGIGAVGSSIAWHYHRPVLAISVLLLVAAVDFVLFAVMPDVLVCYRCRARHAGGDISQHPVFDHETAERYRQENLRLHERPSTQGGR